MAQTVKRLPTMQETWVQPLGWEDLLEKEMATRSGILAWKIPWTEEPGWLQSIRWQRVGLSNFTFTFNSQRKLELEEQSWRHHTLPAFKIYYKSIAIKNSMVLV